MVYFLIGVAVGVTLTIMVMSILCAGAIDRQIDDDIAQQEYIEKWREEHRR